jgi:hypothetical protein
MTSEKVWNYFPQSIHVGSERVNLDKYLVSRTLWRPRDIINFVNLCIEESFRRNSESITEEIVLASEVVYSRQRAEALVDEWKYTYPDISHWIDQFAGGKTKYSLPEVQRDIKLDKSICDILYQVGFLGFRDNGVLKFSFSSQHESPIPGRELLVNRTFHQFLLTRAEQLGKSVSKMSDPAEIDIESEIEDATTAIPDNIADSEDQEIFKPTPDSVEFTQFQSIILPSKQKPLAGDQSKKIFICYPRESMDSIDFLERFIKLIKPLVNQGQFEIYYDRCIPAGEDWKQVINSYLSSSDIALLLLSPDFFSSDFIRDHEIPLILRRQQAGKLKLYPIIIESHPTAEHIVYKFPDPSHGPESFSLSKLQYICDIVYKDAQKDQQSRLLDSLMSELVKHR